MSIITSQFVGLILGLPPPSLPNFTLLLSLQVIEIFFILIISRSSTPVRKICSVTKQTNHPTFQFRLKFMFMTKCSYINPSEIKDYSGTKKLIVSPRPCENRYWQTKVHPRCLSVANFLGSWCQSSKSESYLSTFSDVKTIFHWAFFVRFCQIFKE